MCETAFLPDSRDFMNAFLRNSENPIDKPGNPCYTCLNQRFYLRRRRYDHMKDYFESLVRSNYRCGRMFTARAECAGCFVVPFSSVRFD